MDLDAIRRRVDASRRLLRATSREDGSTARHCAVLLATWQQLDGVVEALAVGDTDLADARFRAAIDFPLEPIAGAVPTGTARDRSTGPGTDR